MVKNYSIRRAVRRIISTHQTGWGRSMGRMTYNLELECGHQQLRPESRPVNHSAGVYVQGDVHTNTVESAFSLLKRGIMGTWHNISAKHLLAYLNEMTFRFNRRHNDDLFVETLRYMVNTDPLRFADLVK